MIEAYLLYVHPILPVIEVDVLLRHYRTGQLQEYNTLLLWSLFFVAVNVCRQVSCSPFANLTKHTVHSGTHMRARRLHVEEGNEICDVLPSQGKNPVCRTLISRILELTFIFEQCMYENGNERNKIVLLQASLLMGFWHSEIDEHAQPWYWTGTAISHCQILGLHRDPGTSTYNPHITNRQRSFRRRLWWSCFFRDRWLGLTLGRPLRINLDDSDVPMPLAGDMLFDIEGLGELALADHLPSDMHRLSEYWVILIEISRQLGDVLVMSYQAARPRRSLSDVEALERQLLQSRLPDPYEGGLTRFSKFYSNHVHLHYQ